jgi:sigma-E factor negative regulatory protein RseC
MDNIQEGIIIKNDGAFAVINAAGYSGCESCGACESSKLTILAHNPLNAAPGQKVRFVTAQGNMLKIAFILFFLPLVFIFIGATVGYLISKTAHINQTILMLVSGTLFFILSIFNIIRYDRKYKLKPDNFARITEIIG